jgi:DNA-binding NtrC family response regulator
MSSDDPSAKPVTRQIVHTAMASACVEVVVIHGSDAGRSAKIGDATGKIVVGTSPMCDLRLSDPTVSRSHASLELSEFGLLVTDLGSTNGTTINDARVAAGYLTSRDCLCLGSTVLQASTYASEGAAAMPAPVSFGRMASTNPRMHRVFQLCRQLAPTDVPIVLEGETGTGKELLAECIHEASARASAPFIVLDCRTTPNALLESHLFGEVARDDGSARPGIFELARGGTLLIDEPGDLALEVQTKLLRALDGGTFVPVGDTTPVQADVRVIVATARNLDKLIEENKFREDLYYRLAGARIEIPPLRRRREDIPLLASELWMELGGKGFAPDEFLDRFEAYDWPGNVRELAKAIERFLVLGSSVSLLVARGYRLTPRTDLPANAAGEDILKRVVASNLGFSEARQRVLDAFERAYLEKALADSKGNVAAAAAASGIARRYFQRIRARQR